jgi:uncharacterized membrane protein
MVHCRQRFGIVATITIVVAVSLPNLFAGAGVLNAQETQLAENAIDFANDIKPIFEASCIRCHGPEQQDGDFRIDEKDTVMNYIDEGDSSFSELFDHVSSDDEELMMPPPDEGGPLAKELIDKIRRWIDEGANWPEAVSIEMPAPEVVQEIVAETKKVELEKDKQEGNWQLVWEIAGLLHPILVHFPVGLIIGGAFFALIGFRGESPLSDAAYYCLWLAAWLSILTCFSGWSFGYEKNYNDWQGFDFNKSIDIHRWGGILISVLAFLLALVASSSRRRDPYGTGAFWKFSLILLAGLTGFVAHHGGKMTHHGLHDKLLGKSDILYRNLVGQKEVVPNKPDGPPLDEQPQAETPKQQVPPVKTEINGDDPSTTEGNAETSGDNKQDENGGAPKDQIPDPR